MAHVANVRWDGSLRRPTTARSTPRAAPTSSRDDRRPRLRVRGHVPQRSADRRHHRSRRSGAGHVLRLPGPPGRRPGLHARRPLLRHLHGRLGYTHHPVGLLRRRRRQETRRGTLVIDVTVPAAPHAVGFIGSPAASHNQTVHPSGLCTVQLEQRGGNGNIEVISLADLDQARDRQRCLATATEDSHDLDVLLRRHPAYSAALDHTLILDTDRPRAPRSLGSITTPRSRCTTRPTRSRLATAPTSSSTTSSTAPAATRSAPAAACTSTTSPATRTAPEKVGAFFGPTSPPRGLPPAGPARTVSCTAHVFRIYPEHQGC